MKTDREMPEPADRSPGAAGLLPPTLAAGLAGLAFGALGLLAETLPGIRAYLTFYRPLGCLSGIMLSTAVVLAIAWVSLAALRLGSAISLAVGIAMSLLMLCLGTTLLLLGISLHALGY
ncbi:hypothetical protein [Thiomonas sp. FB-Cd]|uniref:hypothetical protein n=1 Tax=Thiomonas sp. FB-Cd TaxID=1158292 RepID=UPI0004DF091F|nr:hypothetical protein [Thiomonas sp. FB-Cd]